MTRQLFAVRIQDTIPVAAEDQAEAEQIARDIASGSHDQSSAWDTFLMDGGEINAAPMFDLSQTPGWTGAEIPFGDTSDDVKLSALIPDPKSPGVCSGCEESGYKPHASR